MATWGGRIRRRHKSPFAPSKGRAYATDADGIFGAHGVDECTRENGTVLSPSLTSGRRLQRLVAETEGPLRASAMASKTLQLHVDVARQHPLFWTTCSWGILFAYSVEELALMRAHAVPVTPDEGAGLLLTYGSILGTRTMVWRPQIDAANLARTPVP